MSIFREGRAIRKAGEAGVKPVVRPVISYRERLDLVNLESEKNFLFDIQ
jgi:hypothetical protein